MSDYPIVEKEIFDVNNENLQKLASLFPSAVKDGQLDIDALKEELGQFEEVGQEKYELTWAGKQNAKKEARRNIVGKTLRCIEDDGFDEDTTQNLYIEGDNLEVLKLLRKNYYGSIKMIYIDPPYNTGNDAFLYEDDFSISQEEVEKLQGERDEYGIKLIKNAKDSARFHTVWLNKMYPKLLLAKDLLADDGVIFISIGDDEIDNLKEICDEIFGQENRCGIISRLMKSGGAKGRFFSPNIEYILVYCKNNKSVGDFREPISQEIIDKLYTAIEEDGTRKGERYRSFGLYQSSLDARPNQRYYIECPDGELVIPPGETFPDKKQDGEMVLPKANDGCWRWSKDRYILEKSNGNIAFKKSAGTLLNSDGLPAKWNIYTKIWLKEREDEGMVPVNLITKWENRQSSKELAELQIPFDFAKPVDLIKYLINLISDSENATILDFFSGLGTTAQAVMQLNSEDNGNRKFILVQLPELTEDGSESKKLGYNNICEIGKERIRRAGQKIKEEIEQGNQQLKLGEEPKKVPDIGFKVFRVDETTLNWEKMALSGVDMLHDYKADTSQKDRLDFTPTFGNDLNVVYEIMLRQEGLPLTSKIDKLTEIGNRTYLVADSYLISLEENITGEMVDKLAQLNPLPIKFVFRDSAFGDDIALKDTTFRKLSALIDKNSNEDKQTYTVEFI